MKRPLLQPDRVSPSLEGEAPASAKTLRRGTPAEPSSLPAYLFIRHIFPTISSNTSSIETSPMTSFRLSCTRASGWRVSRIRGNS